MGHPLIFRWVLLSSVWLISCGGRSSEVTGNESASDASPRSIHPAKVEPTRRRTFGAGEVTPEGTEFYIFVVTKVDTTDFMLNLCGEPCSTATAVKTWYAEEYQSGDELSQRVNVQGEYYLWAPDRTFQNDAPTAVSDELRGDKLHITFNTGCVIDAWYTTP